MFNVYKCLESGAIERIKSKVILTYPRDVEIVDLMEQLLSGGYSSIHMRLGFDTGMSPKSEKYIKEKEQIIKDMRNLCGEPNEKVKKKELSKKLYELFKQEDVNSRIEPIYYLRLDGKNESHKRRVFSKIFK